MKIGCPEYYVPSPSMVSHNVNAVFASTCKCITKMLQEYNGRISFATNAWTLPNHKAYVAVTAHLEHEGKPLCFLLDVVEVAKSHSGINLASVFAQILKEFGIEQKVRLVVNASFEGSSRVLTRSWG
jgi:hypothetical protein